MRLELRDGLLFASLSITYKGKTKKVENVVLDTGAAQSIVSPDAIDRGAVNDPDYVRQDLEGILRSSFVYSEVKKENPKKADILINLTRMYLVIWRVRKVMLLVDLPGLLTEPDSAVSLWTQSGATGLAGAIMKPSNGDKSVRRNFPKLVSG